MLLNYLPEFMQDIKEMQMIMNPNDKNIDKMHRNIDIILDNMFVKYATLSGIEQYESMLNIYPNITDSICDRKDRILAIYNEVLPFTEHTLINILNFLCGKDGYIYEISYTKLYLKIFIKLKKKQFENDIRNIVERIVPMNIFLSVSIKYNIWNDLRSISWTDASTYIWDNIKEEELK